MIEPPPDKSTWPPGLPRTIAEYADAYLADLLDPLTADMRHVIVQSLTMGYLGGPFPDREMVQRLIEVQTGRITPAQYDSWVMESVGRLPTAEPGGGIGHILGRLENGYEVGGTREKMLELLSAMDDTTSLVPAITDAANRGLLSRAEADAVLSAALSLPVLPPVVPLPDDIEPLPDNYPPPTPDYGCVSIPAGTVIHGFATLDAYQASREIIHRVSAGELDPAEGEQMLEALKSDYIAGEPSTDAG